MPERTPDHSLLRYAAFTHDGRGGNPAGVVLDAKGLEDAARLEIAAAVNYSETAFVEAVAATDAPDDAFGPRRQYNVRYFSPLAQVAFCGHATIATAVALADRDGTGPLLFHTLAGPIAIETERGPLGTTATMTSPPTSTRPAQPDELAAALGALGWRFVDLDPQYPAHVSFAGNDHLVLACASRELLADLDYDFPLSPRSWLLEVGQRCTWSSPSDPTCFTPAIRSHRAASSRIPPRVRRPRRSEATFAHWVFARFPGASPSSKVRTWGDPVDSSSTCTQMMTASR